MTPQHRPQFDEHGQVFVNCFDVPHTRNTV